jgi:hypothetical protein
MGATTDRIAATAAESSLLSGWIIGQVDFIARFLMMSGCTVYFPCKSHFTKNDSGIRRANYERATAPSIFDSTPSCAKITVPDG